MASMRNMTSGGLSLGGAFMKRSFMISPVPSDSKACVYVRVRVRVRVCV